MKTTPSSSPPKPSSLHRNCTPFQPLRRISARLRCDFTPSIRRRPLTGITLADGSTLLINTGTATDGAPIYRLVAPPPRKGGLIRKQWDSGLQIFRDRLAIITGPDKRDRLVQFLYTQLPYHPQRIEKNTAWTVETSEPISISPQTNAVANSRSLTAHPGCSNAVRHLQTWIIQAYLDDQLSSATSNPAKRLKPRSPNPFITQTIRSPSRGRYFDWSSHTSLSQPVASVEQACSTSTSSTHPSHRTTQNVQVSLTGVDSAAGQNLALDSEGQVKPKPQNKLLCLSLFSSSPPAPLT